MASLFEDPKQLVRSDKITEFWPVVDHTAEERVNATARFIVYATCILYLIRRDVRVFVLGVTGLGVLYVMEKSNMIKDGMARPVFAGQGGSSCQLPTRDNPMANVLMNEYMDRPDRPSACEYSSVDDKVNNMLSDRIPYGPSRSRSALPEQQHGCGAARGDPLDDLHDRLHGRAPGGDRAAAELLQLLAAVPGDHILQPTGIESPGHGLQQVADIEGLADVVTHAAAQSLHGARDAGVGGDHDDRQVGGQFA